jgi:hypothetical protein
MQIRQLALRKLPCILILVSAGFIPGHAFVQSDQEKDKSTSPGKKTEASTKGDIEILSDTVGVDFAPYMKRLRYTVHSHWKELIPDVALPPLRKSGVVKIEFAIETRPGTRHEDGAILGECRTGQGRMGWDHQRVTAAQPAHSIQW